MSILISKLKPKLVDLMQKHLVLFFEFMLAEKLPIMFAFQVLNSLSQLYNLLLLFSDSFKMVRFANQYFIRIVYYLPQFYVFSSKLSYN